ncbi:unnamed protein product [Calypogeia fissa]
MDQILAGLDFVRYYINDILVFSTMVAEYELHLQAVFQRIRAFVRLANYYRRYVKGFSRIVKPLFSLLKVDQEWHWGEE